MAVRKLRKQMKPIIWGITIAFFLSMILVGVSSMKSSMNREQVAFVINGKKVAARKVEVAINSSVSGYSQYLKGDIDRELISTVTMANVIDKELTLELAKKLKVKVAKGDVNKEYKEIEASIGDKQQFNRMLQGQGYNTNTFKAEIKEGMIIDKTMEKIESDIVLTDEEIMTQYNEEKYGVYNGKTYEEAKEQIEDTLKKEKSGLEYAKLLATEKNSMKFELKDTRYEPYLEKTEIEMDGFTFSNYDVAKRTLRNLFMTQGNLELAKGMSNDNITRDVKLAKEAVVKGVEVEENLPIELKLYELRLGLTDKLREEYKATDEELMAYFEARKIAYDIVPSVSANIAVFNVVASEKDKEIAKKKAIEILNEVTPENFADMAKSKSEGPSGPNGGELGWFGKGQMVAPFEEAAFKGEAGKIYNEVVETQFGYHIIYVAEKNDDKVNASHILIKVAPSNETRETILGDARKAAEDVNAKVLEFVDLANGSSVASARLYEDVRNGGYIDTLGYKTQLTNDLFAGEQGVAAAVEADGGIYVIQKVSEKEYKEASFGDVRDRVRFDYLNQKVQEELQKIIS